MIVSTPMEPRRYTPCTPGTRRKRVLNPLLEISYG